MPPHEVASEITRGDDQDGRDDHDAATYPGPPSRAFDCRQNPTKGSGSGGRDREPTMPFKRTMLIRSDVLMSGKQPAAADRQRGRERAECEAPERCPRKKWRLAKDARTLGRRSDDQQYKWEMKNDRMDFSEQLSQAIHGCGNGNGHAMRWRAPRAVGKQEAVA